MTRAVVLMRGILDPDLAEAGFGIDPATNRPLSRLGAAVLGPFERSALELALQLRDAGDLDLVDLLAAGEPTTVELLRKALAAGADNATLVDAEALDSLDPWPTVEVLARAIEHTGAVDLLLAGHQAGDWDNGQVGYLLAERLGWPCIGLARRVWREDGLFHAVRDTPTGQEEVEFGLPAVVTATTDASNVLRLAKVPALLAAARKPLERLTLADLGLSGDLSAHARLDVLSVRPVERTSDVEILEAETPAEVVTALALRLLDLRAGH
jgi:electron transfer flavoprotein beta subunit